MEIKERLMQYLDNKGVSPTKAEQLLGWGKGALIKAKSISVDKTGEFLLLFSDLSAEWLLRGDGEMLRESSSLPLTSERESIYKELFERKEKELAESRKRIEELIAHNAKLEQELTVFTMKKTDVQEAENASDAAIKLKPTGTDDL